MQVAMVAASCTQPAPVLSWSVVVVVGVACCCCILFWLALMLAVVVTGSNLLMVMVFLPQTFTQRLHLHPW